MNLRSQIIGTFAAGVGLAILSTTTILSIRNVNEIRHSLITERLSLIASIDHSIETGLQKGLEGEFSDYIRDRLNFLVEDGNFYVGVIYDSELTPLLIVPPTMGEPPALSDETLKQFPALNESAKGLQIERQGLSDLFASVSPLSVNGELFGYVVLYYNNASIVEEVRRTVYLSIAVGIIALLLGGGVFGYFLDRLVSPLGALTKHIIDMGRSDLSGDIPHQSRHDEIGDLARALEMLRGHALENRRLSIERDHRKAELRLALEKAEEANAELERQKNELNELAVKAEQASRAKSEFLANMSHEIRTPMHGVLGVADVLLATELSEQQRELASIIASSGSALMHVINDILDFSKIESGKLELVDAPFNLYALIDDIFAMMQARAVKNNLELITKYAPNLPHTFVGDESRIRQVLTNLIGNAIKFTEAGHVLINVSGDVHAEKANLIIDVEDTGIGIAAEDLSRMFEKFEQADASKARKFEGTGLGLSITKSLVELMEGEIGVKSELGVGSAFTVKITLPFVSQSTSIRNDTPEVFFGVRVLIVESKEDDWKILCEALERADLRYVAVGSADAAFEELEKSHLDCDRFHLIVVDYRQPKDDAERVCVQILGDDRFSRIPLVAVASSKEVDAIHEEAQAKLAGVLAKPIRPEPFLDMLATVLQEASAGKARTMAALLKDKEKSPKKAPTKRKGNAPAASPQKKKVLVAEDNLVNQQVIRAMLGADKLDILIVENGAEAVDRYSEMAPDLILMDLSMPVMDGYEAARRIRAIEFERGNGRTPIIAATAHAHEEDHKKCFEAGMDDVIAKPFRKQMIEDALDRWIDVASDQKDQLTG